jgi:carboxypeptidase family protein
MIAVLLLAAVCLPALQFGNSNYGNGGSMAPPPPKKQVTSRTLSGLVMNKKDDPLAEAVVYLKDLKNDSVRTYITAKDGSYRFNGLTANQDYEVYAQLGKARSDIRTLSSFDSRSQPTLNLRVDAPSK